MSDNRGVVPRKAIIGAGLILAITMAFAAYGSITGLNLPGEPDSEPRTSVPIRVDDRPDGSVAVYDADTNELIDTVAPGENGFIRGAMPGPSPGQERSPRRQARRSRLRS